MATLSQSEFDLEKMRNPVLTRLQHPELAETLLAVVERKVPHHLLPPPCPSPTTA